MNFFLPFVVSSHPVQDEENANPNSIFITTNVHNIFESTSFSVVAEGLEVCKTDSILHSLGCYMAAFYAFNLAYVPRLQKTISFIQNFLLGINDGSVIDKPVLTLFSRLSKINK